MRHFTLICLCLPWLWPPQAEASPRQKIAVLQFTNVAGLEDQEASYITDLVREAALRLPRDQFFVLTRENILQALPPGTDLAQCEADCEVETGRNIGADYVVSGEIIRFGDAIKVPVRLHDTRSGALLSTARASARAVDERLERAIQNAGRELFTALKPQSPAQVIEPKPSEPRPPEPQPPEVTQKPPSSPARKPDDASEVVFQIRSGVSLNMPGISESEPGYTNNGLGGLALSVGLGFVFPAGSSGLPLSFQVELLWHWKQYTHEPSDDSGQFFDANVSATYIEVPMLARLDLSDRRNALPIYMLGGIAVGFLNDSSVDDGLGEEVSYDGLQDRETSWLVGLGFEMAPSNGGLFIEGRYQQSLNSITDRSQIQHRLFTSALGISF